MCLQSTLNHCKLMLRMECAGQEVCAFRHETRRSTRCSGQPHYVCYYVSTFHPWCRVVDMPKLMREASKYTYIRLRVGQPQRLLELVEQQLGKPINRKGFFCNYVLGTRFGVTLDSYTTQVFEERKEWMCCELFMCLLIDQSMGSNFASDPCKTLPLQLWDYARHIPGSQLYEFHPSITQQPLDNDIDFPPGRPSMAL